MRGTCVFQKEAFCVRYRGYITKSLCINARTAPALEIFIVLPPPLNPTPVRRWTDIYDAKTPYFPYYYIYVWHITRRTAANHSGPEMQKKFCISIKFYYIVGAKVPHSDSLQRYRATKGKPYTSHKTTKAKFHRPPPATGLHTEETLKRTKRKTSRRTAMAAAQWRF